ncbi:MAG TPA: AI-2E family transporter [Xanthobacteraceae bacterium]|jgi:predicted PurR-regulated permease PerM
MNYRHLAFWGVVLVVGCALLWLLREVLLPFVAGIALAYVLAPVADRLERAGLNRTLAALSIVGIVVLSLIALALLIIPLAVQQGLLLLSSIPSYVARVRELIAASDRPWSSWLQGGDSSKALSDFMRYASTWLTGFASSLWVGGRALLSLVSILVVMPVVTFYLIRDWHRMLNAVDACTPLHYRATVHELARAVDAVISGFLRGQLGVCFLLGLYYSIALGLVGLNFGLLIGALSGLITFIPYVGSLSGLLVATSVAIAQFWPDWVWIVAVVAIFLLGQFVEGNIIAPKLVGERVGLHPVWLIFAMFAFGYLFGFVGLLVAVPLAAVAAVLVRFALGQYRASALYKGEDPIR